MNFDINQDFSSLQNVRRNRGKGIRPGKPKAKPSAVASSKPVEKHPTQGSCVPSGRVQDDVLHAMPKPSTEAAVIGTRSDHVQPTTHQVAAPQSRLPSDIAQQRLPLPEQAAGLRTPAPEAKETEARHTTATAGPSRPIEQPEASYIPVSVGRGSVPQRPEQRESPVVEDLPHVLQRKAPVRKRSVPELGTNVSKKPVKPRKKKKAADPKVPAATADYESSVAMVSCDANGEDEEQPPMAVTKAAVNHYDEMTRALCAGKRPKGKRKKIDPTAPIDPKNMTLMDVIRHAHSNANILDRQYKELKASQEKEKAQTAAAETEDAPAPPEPRDAGPSTDHNPIAPQLVLRDGKIVVDQGSLTVQANIPVGVRTLEIEEEDDDTLINSHSYLPVSKLTKERWTQQETELFYQVLRSYGADFTFMSQCFQGRTRKQVKNKYLKEERVNPARVKAAMSGSQTATLAQLTSLAQPGTAAADIGAMLPAGEGVPGNSTGIRQACAEDEDDECLGTAVDPTLADFFY